MLSSVLMALSPFSGGRWAYVLPKQNIRSEGVKGPELVQNVLLSIFDASKFYSVIFDPNFWFKPGIFDLKNGLFE